MIDEGGKERILLINAYSLLCQKSPAYIDRVFSMNFGEALRFINFKSQNSQINLAATEAILDYHFRPKTAVREWLKESSKQSFNQSRQLFDRYVSQRDEFPSQPFLIAPRRWNSWTPNLPRPQITNHINAEYQKSGGGYFISDGESTVVVDPGYGFLELLNHFHHLTVMDIDSIFITHDHPDHSSELQNILSLRHVYRRFCRNKLKIYLNPSSYFLYKNLISYYSKILDNESPKIVFPEQTLEASDCLRISTIGMDHYEIYDYLEPSQKQLVDETISGSKALGLTISIQKGSFTSKIALPGDTSFPKEAEKMNSWIDFYKDSDIASIHLGSIEDEWARDYEKPASEINYQEMKHLGLNGAIKFLNIVKPKTAVISEFGEELDSGDFRLSISALIKDLLIDKNIHVVPSDCSLFLLMSKEIYFKCNCGDYFVPIEKMHYTVDAKNFIKYEFRPGCKTLLNHYTCVCGQWAQIAHNLPISSIRFV